MMKLRWQALLIWLLYVTPEASLCRPVKNENASYMPPPTWEPFELSAWRSMLLMQVSNVLTPLASIVGRLHAAALGYFMMPPHLVDEPNIISPLFTLPPIPALFPIP